MRWAIVAAMRYHQPETRNGSILPWALPHVPCHTFNLMRAHYDFDLVLVYHGASLSTDGLLVCYMQTVH